MLAQIRQIESSHMRSCTACSTSGPPIGRTALTTLEVSF